MHSKELLTKSQKEVLQLIYDGKSNKDIAQILNLKMSTVTSRVQEVTQLLGCENRAGTIRVGLRFGYLEPPKREPAPTRPPRKQRDVLRVSH